MLETRGKLPQELHKITRRAIGCEQGQTMAEYAVVLAVITLAIVSSFGLLSNSIEGILTAVKGVFS
jgi:Flp pilus assembly protein, pilin Flp